MVIIRKPLIMSIVPEYPYAVRAREIFDEFKRIGYNWKIHTRHRKTKKTESGKVKSIGSFIVLNIYEIGYVCGSDGASSNVKFYYKKVV